MQGLPQIHIKREKLVEKLIQQVNEDRVILIQSPAMTGKSALAELIRRTIEQNEEVILSTSYLAWSQKHNDTLTKSIGHHSLKRYIIIENIQLCYKNCIFWDQVKRAMDPSINTSLSLILFASHNITIPIQLKTFSYFDICLTHDEFDELLKVQSLNVLPFTDEGIASMLWNTTLGHIGLIQQILIFWYNLFIDRAKSGQIIHPVELKREFFLQKYGTMIDNSRGCPSIQTEDEWKILSMIFHNAPTFTIDLSEDFSDIEKQSALNLVKNDVLVLVDKTLSFTCPAIQTSFLRKSFMRD